jgi:hypothetical protein
MFYVLRVIGYPLREEKGSPMSQQANKATERSRPYAFFVAAIAIGVAFLAFLFSILLFGDLFNNATTVIAALGSLFTLIGTIVGAYFGIKVSNDTSERSRGAIEKAHGAARWRPTSKRRRQTRGRSRRTTRRRKPWPSWIPTWLGGSWKASLSSPRYGVLRLAELRRIRLLGSSASHHPPPGVLCALLSLSCSGPRPSTLHSVYSTF